MEARNDGRRCRDGLQNRLLVPATVTRQVGDRCEQSIRGRWCYGAARVTCAGCGKAVCVEHSRLGRVPESRSFERTCPEFCTTCSAMEIAYGRPAETFSNEERDRFLQSYEGLGLGVTGRRYR
jgi:hypothetical protein